VEEQQKQLQNREQTNIQAVSDENPNIQDSDKLPIHPPLKVLRYKTVKKNNALGWWSAVVLLEDHQKKQVCFYRWRKRKNVWKRDKKLPFRTRTEWNLVKGTIESFISELD
jgi:hypothetical protein